jgi:sec-independent protein translocase protein TatA
MVAIPAFIGIPGGPELLIILLVAVLIFGADKLPKLARSSGQAMGEFRRGRSEIEEELKRSAAGTDEPAEEESTARVASPVTSRTDD